MSSIARAEAFAEALQNFERTGNEADLHDQFGDTPQLVRPELPEGGSGSDDVSRFWKTYLDQFSDISTEFTDIAEAGELAVLEWESVGTLANDRAITYRGVSLLTFDGDRVKRFSTYYDTAAFVAPK